MASSPSSSSDSLTRRERERQMRRRAMLDAARAVFAERGYGDATLDEIAARAEFGKGTLYNYFEGGKEDLLFAVFDEIYQEIATLIRTVFQDEPNSDRSLREAFHAYAVRHFEIIRDQQDLFLVLVKEGHRLAFSDDEKQVEFFRRQHERLVDALTPALDAATENEEIRSFPPSAVANLLLANVRGMGIHSVHEQCYGSPEDTPLLKDPEAAADFLTSFLFDGLQESDAPPNDRSPNHT